MKRPKVYIFRNIPKDVEEYISEFCNYEIFSENSYTSNNKILDRIFDADGLMIPPLKVDENFLNHCPNVKVISNFSVGYNNLDLKTMTSKGIIGTNTHGSLDDTVADLIMGLILATARRISELDSFVKEGKWDKGQDDIFYGKDVSYSSLGIIGLGNIGQCVAKRAKLGFNMDVYYYNKSRKEEIENALRIEYMDLELLLETCEFIVLMIPLNDETYHFMNEEKFFRMKNSAIFINASRGKVVDEKALICALEEKRILAAGLDVFEQEPVELDNPLLSMPNVITLPHIASTTAKTRNNMIMSAARNMVDALYGRQPEGIIPELKHLINKNIEDK